MTVEPEHLLARRVNVIRDEHTQSPRLGILGTREKVSPSVFKLLLPPQRDDDPSKRLPVGAREIRCMAHEGRPHIFTGRRKEAGVVDEAIEKGGDRFQRHHCPLVMVMSRNLSPTGW